MNLLGGTIKGGSYTSADGAELVFTTSGGTLDGVTANANLDLSNGGGTNATIVDGLTLNGVAYLGSSSTSVYNYARLYFSTTETLGGSGSIVFSSGYGSGSNAIYLTNGGTTLTIGPGITIHGANGTISYYYSNNVLVNQGTIAADTSGGTVSVNVSTLTNQGTMSASNSGILTLGGTWSNTGTISESSATVNLGGLFTPAGLGTFNRSGGTVNLTGTLDSTGTTLALNAGTGSWNLSGGTLKGGSYTASGGAELVFTPSGGTLDGVTANSALDLSQGSGTNVTIV